LERHCVLLSITSVQKIIANGFCLNLSIVDEAKGL
jgi:hypothetical protein